MKVVERIRRIFDLGADPLRIAEDLSRDPRLKPLWTASGLRVPGVWDGFELAVHAILGQQLTVTDSTALAGDWCKLLEDPFKHLQGLTHLFPEPKNLVAADLSRAGIRGPRVAALHALARAVCERETHLRALDDLEEAISRI